MTKQERTKQLKRRYFWFFWVLLCIICWVPFFKTRVFGAEVEYPTAGATSILTEVLSKPVVETEEVEVVQATYEEESEIESVDVSSDLIYSARRFKRLGVVYYGGYKYTYYSDLVLHGGGLKIPGRHYDENGYICDENSYGTRLDRVAQKNKKAVLQYDLNGNFLKEWASASDVQKKLGYKRTNITNCCNGKQKTSNGFVWRYKVL